jgi:hypothetical protein
MAALRLSKSVLARAQPPAGRSPPESDMALARYLSGLRYRDLSHDFIHQLPSRRPEA